jgi:hypothetical protein
MSYQPRKLDLSNIDTRSAARRTTQEELDVARVQASGAGAKNEPRGPQSEALIANPELQAWAKAEAERRAGRAVMGLTSRKGRQPMYVLSHEQFAEFKATGAWSGDNPKMPTPEEYGPHSYKPEDKEWTPL